MRMFLARREKKLHSIIWVANSEEASSFDRRRRSMLDSPEEIRQLNAFLTAKDPYSFITAVSNFGRPMIQHELRFHQSLGDEALKLKRRYSADEFLNDRTRRKFSTGSRRMLANESWMLVPGATQTEKENSARRAVAAFDPESSESLDSAIHDAGSDAVVVVEPLHDWLTLKNMLVLMLTIKHALQSALRGEAVDYSAMCGIVKAEATDFGLVDALNETSPVYAAPVFFNDIWRNESLKDLALEAIQVLNPLGDTNSLKWGQYSRMGFRNDSRIDGRRAFRLIGNDKIRYIPQISLSGTAGSAWTFKSEWGGNVYLAIEDDGSEERVIVESLFTSFMNSRFENGDYQLDFGLDKSSGGLSATSLESQLWLSLLGADKVKVGICEKCGMPYFASDGSKKRYCSRACSHA